MSIDTRHECRNAATFIDEIHASVYVPDMRIPAKDLRSIRNELFSQAFTGASLAASLRTTTNTLWVNFYRNGLSTDVAHKIARKLFHWATRMEALAVELEGLAEAYENIDKEKSA